LNAHLVRLNSKITQILTNASRSPSQSSIELAQRQEKHPTDMARDL
jgi:hypothetical protein